MTGTFGAAAERLAGIVPRTLGWLPDDFWGATPAELAVIFAAGAEHPAGETLARSELIALMERDRNG